MAKTVRVSNSKGKKESCTRSTLDTKRIETTWKCCSIMKINCIERKSNREVLNTAREPRKVIETIETKIIEFIKHVIRHNIFVKNIIKWKIDKKNCGTTERYKYNKAIISTEKQ